jgi:hypothetical protein
MQAQLRPALMALAVLTLITGFLYPLVITGIAQVLFPRQANGSLILIDGKPVGSSLIGQPFDAPKYFWSRPSATAPFPYNAAASSGSNLGPTNEALIKAVQTRIDALKAADPGNPLPSGGFGHCLREWARSAYQSCICCIPGETCRARPEDGRGRGSSTGVSAYGRASVGNSWRTSGKRAGSESCTGYSGAIDLSHDCFRSQRSTVLRLSEYGTHSR